MSEDRHQTKKLSQWLAIVFSAVFFAIGVAGYQRTHDHVQLLVFFGLSILTYNIVIFVFSGVNRLLDSVDDRSDDDK